MPFVRIGVSESLTRAQRRTIADCIHQSLVEVVEIPPDDRFQLLDVYDADSMYADPQYLGVSRSKHVVFVQVFLRRGRSVQLKQRLYKRIAESLHVSAQIRREDVFITLVENELEDWSFGNGVAQYVERQTI
jgi:phenylpyruvate tautomerase PptA (4-oxalocrotonate tautomerase family)